MVTRIARVAPPNINRMTEGAAVPRRSRASWKLALRLAVTAAFLALLISKAHDADDAIPSQHHGITVFLLLAALGCTFLGVVLSAWRWQRVLLLFDVHVPIRTLTSTYLAGLFVGNVLPSTIGGDVLRVARTTDDAHSSQISFASVVLERLTGFVALPLLVFLGFALRPSMLDKDHAKLALVIAIVTWVLLAVILVFAGHPRMAGRYADNANWTRFIGAVHVGVDRLRREPRQLGPVIGTALLYQLSVVIVFMLVFRALDLPVPLTAALAFSPAVLMIQVLPISIGGLGLREGALVVFLHPFLKGTGVTDARVFAAGLLWYGCLIVVSMLGAPSFAIGRRKTEPQKEDA